MSRPLVFAWFVFAWFIFLVACQAGSPPDAGVTSAADSAALRCPADSPTVVRGLVQFPNGLLPVSGATVYHSPTGMPVARHGECGQCVNSATLGNYDLTEVDGRFEIMGVPAGAQTLIVEKAGFRRTVELDVTACQVNEVDADASRLPRSRTEGEIPRIAVVTGEYDHLDTVLLRLGLTIDTFDVYADTFDSTSGAQAFLRDAEALGSYAYVFVNCGASFAESVASDVDPEGTVLDAAPFEDGVLVENLRRYVRAGGRLYVTDWAYDVFEQTFPEVVDFGGAWNRDGLASDPEPINAGQLGSIGEEKYVATVEDERLREWLAGIDALEADGRLRIDDASDSWAVMERIDEERAKAWVSADVRWRGPDDPNPADFGLDGPPPDLEPGSMSGSLPLTLSTDDGCGRGFVTSYHTVSLGSGGERGDSPFYAQELVLAYTILEVGTCIEDPVLF